MTARSSRWEVVRTPGQPQPWHARFRAVNGRIICSTETYVRKAGALGGIAAIVFPARIQTDEDDQLGVCIWGHLWTPIHIIDKETTR